MLPDYLNVAAKTRARAGAAVTVQKVVRMFLERRVHNPRYVGVRDISNFKSQILTLTEIVEKLPKNKEKYLKVRVRCWFVASPRFYTNVCLPCSLSRRPRL